MGNNLGTLGIEGAKSVNLVHFLAYKLLASSTKWCHVPIPLAYSYSQETAKNQNAPCHD